MSAFDQGPLSKYNSLTDRHLMSYFSNDRMRRHLVKNGLITKGGEVVSDAVYRVRIARREHRRRVRDLIAQAIIHKALEMERSRQIDIRKKIEEIAKIELVRRVRTDCNRLGDEECLSYFNEGNMEAKTRSKTPQAKNTKPKSRDLEDTRLPSTPDQESRMRLRRILPNEEIETKHLSQLDSLTLGEYARILEKQDRSRMNKLPYLGMGTEYLRANAKSSRERKPSKVKKSRSSKKREKSEDSQDKNVVQSARSSQAKTQSHTTVSVLFHAPANNRSFDVMIIQQPSGGNTITLYKESITNNTVFQVSSHRHKGYPFSVTFYIDNVKDSRISTCCEYKHKVGKRIGGPSGHFSLFSVEGDDPCYRCLAERDLANEKKEKKSKDTKSSEQLNSRHETISVRSASEDRYQSEDDFESGSDSSKSMTDGEERDNEQEDQEEEKTFSHSSHSSANKSPPEKAVIAVNINTHPSVARTKTPEIEVNNDEASEDEVIVTNSNNNAVDVEDHNNGATNNNSGRTSVWTNGSEPLDAINTDREKIEPIKEPNPQDKTEVKVEHNLVLSGDGRKVSISSESSFDSSDEILPDKKENKEIMSSSDDESNYENNKNVEMKSKVILTTEVGSESDESSLSGVAVAITKPNTFLTKLVNDKSESDSSRSIESKKELRNEGVAEIVIGNNSATVKSGIKSDLQQSKPTQNKPIEVTSSSGSSNSSSDTREEKKSKLDDDNKTDEAQFKTEQMVRNELILKDEKKVSSCSSSSSTFSENTKDDVGKEKVIVSNDTRDGRTDINKLPTHNDNDEVNIDACCFPVKEKLTSSSSPPIPEAHINVSTELNMKENEPDDVNIMTPRIHPETSESNSEDNSSSSESGQSSSLSSARINMNPNSSAPLLTEDERESLKIDIPKEDEEFNISPKDDEIQINEPRKGTRSPVLTSTNVKIETIGPKKSLDEDSIGHLRASSSLLSSSVTDSDSEREAPIKVEHQAEEENNVINEPDNSKENAECDVFFANDDISFKKAKEMFERVNGQRVTSLTIKNCELPSYIFNFIATKLETKRDMKRIELTGCEVEISLLKLLAKTLDKWPVLDTLILSNNVFVDYSLFDLMNAIGNIYRKNKVDQQPLKLFDVSKCSLRENDFGQIIKIIAEDAHVENIILDQNSIDRKQWQELRKALETNINTKSISIKNCVNDTTLMDEIKNETSSEIRDRLIIN